MAPGEQGSPAAPATTAATPPERSATSRFFRDVGGDYKHFFSKETAFWYGGGAAAAGLVHFADEDISEAVQDVPGVVDAALSHGDLFGSAAVQYPLAVGWWIAGHVFDSARGAVTGRDLVRAQISATSWTYLLKFSAQRTRPNGDPRSFPSGHASSTFATAMVLQQHYGWKAGVPFFTLATATIVSRVKDNKHWASDVVFGAVVGIASTRTVTLHMRNSKFSLGPIAVPRGAGLAFTRVN